MASSGFFMVWAKAVDSLARECGITDPWPYEVWYVDAQITLWRVGLTVKEGAEAMLSLAASRGEMD